MKKLIIIPTYNEYDNIVAIVSALLALNIPDLHILVVDDNSPDGTARLVINHFASQMERGSVFLLERPHKNGLGQAYVAGFEWALARDYDLILQMDADFSHHPRYVPALIQAAEQGADLVLGSRYVIGGSTRNWGWWRRCISRGGSLYARTILGLSLKDLTGGFKCFRRTVLEALPLAHLQCQGYAFQVEVTYRCALRKVRIVEVPIVFEDRRIGQSKMSRAILFEAIYKVFKLRCMRKQLLG